MAQFLQPINGWRQSLTRPKAAWILGFGLWLVAFSVPFALFQRPYFSAVIVLAGWLTVVLVSNAKFQSLREPFVVSDFEYFTDAIRHPRLYIPFLGLGRFLLAAAGFIAAAVLGWMVEVPLTRTIGWTSFFTGAGIIAAMGIAAIWLATRFYLPITLEPITDNREIGFAASLWQYGVAERRAIDASIYPPIFSSADTMASTPAAESAATSMPTPTPTLPDLMVVQSESFFDVRRVFPGVAANVFREWDQTTDEAIAHGQLSVAAWGANTVRTEFSFLSGLANETLGIHRFNPYRKLALSGISSMATFLQGRGYRTVCIHPYPASFYNRATVFPKLGFDEFIDVSAFTETDKFGAYIGDVAVAEKIKSLLETRNANSGADNHAGDAMPLFMFVITMENHGPLQLETITEQERAELFVAPLPPHCETLAIYVRHLANADAMLGRLREALTAQTRPGYLCVYGDHVPIMPEVYAATSTPDGRTDYFIWHNQAGRVGNKISACDAQIADLGVTLLRHAGLKS